MHKQTLHPDHSRQLLASCTPIIAEDMRWEVPSIPVHISHHSWTYLYMHRALHDWSERIRYSANDAC